LLTFKSRMFTKVRVRTINEKFLLILHRKEAEIRRCREQVEWQFGTHGWAEGKATKSR
jgi:hypothetical protein